ncbi:DUF932 domain-containing protein, partial [Neobacillus niacini]|uniref:DUF932 domain-containing protein n=1 Tax=Neobacillus niacini TaxID=86668 RepID=UPI002FFF0F0E
MPFKLEEIEQRSFKSMEDLQDYVKEEEENYIQVPIEEFFFNQAQFSNDRFYGYKGNWVMFNDEGMEALCRQAGIPLTFLNKLHESGLVSKVLNNYFTTEDAKQKLNNFKFVIDEQKHTVKGLVSNTYVTYSNRTFLDDITQVFPEIMFDFNIEESFIVNTNLSLRLISPTIKAGILVDEDGIETSDISKVGIQFSNGMTGRSSIKASYFVYRLVCSNGLVLPCSHVSGIVKHTGKAETFLERVSKNITPVLKKLSEVPNKIKILGAIPFDLDSLVELGGANYVYNVIPLQYWDQRKRNLLRGEEKIKFDRVKIEEYIRTYATGISKEVFYWRDKQSMFDFINIFT